MTFTIGSKKAFTLIELLVIVAIIGSLVVISLPRFRNTFNNLRFDNFCQILVNRMRYLQERASAQQENYCLDFDLDNKLIITKVKESPEGDFINIQGLWVKNIIIPEGINIETEQASVFFYPDANIDGKEIKISDSQNTATIYINTNIGKIELVKDEQ